MNVIAGGGLVGIITEVGPNYAQIKTVIEDNSYVSGMLIDTGDTCIVKGDIELMDTGLIHLSGFANSVTVRNGDKIVTSISVINIFRVFSLAIQRMLPQMPTI